MVLHDVFVSRSSCLFEEQTVWPDVALVGSDKVLALVVNVVDLEDLRVLHVDPVLDEDLVLCSLVHESCGILLG